MPAKLAVDAGCIISAVVGGHGARRVFLESLEMEFATTLFTIEEVRQSFPRLRERSGVEHTVPLRALQLLPLTIYPRGTYESLVPAAEALISDPKDVDLLALALQLGCPVWTMDSDFQAPGIDRVSTRDLLRDLEKGLQT